MSIFNGIIPFFRKVYFKKGIAQRLGIGSPEGFITDYTGNKYRDTSNGDLYEKASGDNTNTGWTLINGTGNPPTIFPNSFLTTSLSAYESASIGDWVEITTAEYLDIQSDTDSETIGTINNNMQSGSLSNFGSGNTYTFAKNNLASTNNNAAIWCFRFYVGSYAMGGVNKVKARVGTNLQDLGSLPNSSQTNDFACFIKKGGSASLATPYLATVLSSSNRSMYINVGGTAGYFKSGDVSSITGMSNSYDWGIQGLVRPF